MKTTKTERAIIFVGVVLMHVAYYSIWILKAKGVI